MRRRGFHRLAAAAALLVTSCTPSPTGERQLNPVEPQNPETTEEIVYHAPPELIEFANNAIKKIPGSGIVSDVICHRNTIEMTTDSPVYPWIVVGSDKGNDEIGMYINFIDSQNGHRSIDYGMQQVEGNWKPDVLVLSKEQQDTMVAAAQQIVDRFKLNVVDPDRTYAGENCRSDGPKQALVPVR